MGGRVTRLRPLDDDEELAAGAPEPNWEPEPESFPAPRAEYRFRGPATAGWDHPAAESRAAPSATPREEPHPDEPSVRRVESLEGFARRTVRCRPLRADRQDEPRSRSLRRG